MKSAALVNAPLNAPGRSAIGPPGGSANAVLGELLTQTADDLIEEHLRLGREVRFTISTTSMWPALRPGDEVVACRVAPGDVRPGDILLGRSGAAWLAHRLIAVQPDGAALRLITKGDNSLRPDAAWPSGQLRGLVVAVGRAGRAARLDSGPARSAGAALAWLSRAQAALGQGDPGPLRRLLARGLGRALRLGAALALRAIMARR